MIMKGMSNCGLFVDLHALFLYERKDNCKLQETQYKTNSSTIRMYVYTTMCGFGKFAYERTLLLCYLYIVYHISSINTSQLPILELLCCSYIRSAAYAALQIGIMAS